MAFTVKGEYERLLNKQLNSPLGQLPFECGCVCGYVTDLKYTPRHYNEEVHRYIDNSLEVWVKTSFDNKPELAFTITEQDVRKRYQDRKYRYNKKFNILEYYPYKYN